MPTQERDAMLALASEEALTDFLYEIQDYDIAKAKAKALWPLIAAAPAADVREAAKSLNAQLCEKYCDEGTWSSASAMRACMNLDILIADLQPDQGPDTGERPCVTS